MHPYCKTQKWAPFFFYIWVCKALQPWSVNDGCSAVPSVDSLLGFLGGPSATEPNSIKVLQVWWHHIPSVAGGRWDLSSFFHLQHSVKWMMMVVVRAQPHTAVPNSNLTEAIKEKEGPPHSELRLHLKVLALLYQQISQASSDFRMLDMTVSILFQYRFF